MTIMKGDSYPIYLELTLDDEVLTPDMIAELEVCVGDALRKCYTEKEVMFDYSSSRWYIWPTQQETLELPQGPYHVVIRIKYNNQDMEEVQGFKIGKIDVVDTFSEEVI